MWDRRITPTLTRSSEPGGSFELHSADIDYHPMAQLLADGSTQISISEAQYREVDDLIGSTYRKIRCTGIGISHSSGLLIGSYGTIAPQQLSLLSTLAAGAYAATAEMAKLINEGSGFNVHLHEGQNESLYLTGVNDQFYLFVIFGRNTTFGMVRVMVSKIIERLSLMLKDLDVSSGVTITTEQSGEVAEFKDELSSKLVQILGKSFL